jgi:hypothetical protein
MDIRKIITTSVCLAALVLAACTEPRIGGKDLTDQTFGDAVRAAQAQQTLNPNASQNPVAPQGMDGPTAKATIDRYDKSFETPPPPVNVYTIGVGSSGGAAGMSGAR